MTRHRSKEGAGPGGGVLRHLGDARPEFVAELMEFKRERPAREVVERVRREFKPDDVLEIAKDHAGELGYTEGDLGLVREALYAGAARLSGSSIGLKTGPFMAKLLQSMEGKLGRSIIKPEFPQPVGVSHEFYQKLLQLKEMRFLALGYNQILAEVSSKERKTPEEILDYMQRPEVRDKLGLTDAEIRYTKALFDYGMRDKDGFGKSPIGLSTDEFPLLLVDMLEQESGVQLSEGRWVRDILPKNQMKSILAARKRQSELDRRGRIKVEFEDKPLADELTQILNDPDVRDALDKVKYNGLPLSEMKVLRLSYTTSEPQADAKNKAITVPVRHNNVPNDFRRFIIDVLKQPEMRIQDVRNTPSGQELLDSGELDRRDYEKALDLARWRRTNADHFRGRSLMFKLSKPVTVDGFTYRACKVKAVTCMGILQPMGKRHTLPDHPLLHTPGVETMIPEVTADAKVEIREQVNPRGTLIYDNAVGECEKVERWRKDRLTRNIAVASGRYSDLTAEGQPTGFNIQLIADVEDDRTGETFQKYFETLYDKISKNPGKDDVFRQRIDEASVNSDIEWFFEIQGRKLREAHDKGHFIKFPHFDNLKNERGEWNWCDAVGAVNVHSMPPEIQVAHRLIDLAEMVGHIRQFPLYAEEKSRELAGSLGVDAVGAVVRGYFPDMLYDDRLFNVKEADFHGALDLAQETPVTELKHPIIGVLSDLVHRRFKAGLPKSVPLKTYASDKHLPVAEQLFNSKEMNDLKLLGYNVVYVSTAGSEASWRIDKEKKAVFINIAEDATTQQADRYVKKAIRDCPPAF